MDLIDGVVLGDPTLLFRDERWWLFAADGRGTPHTRLLDDCAAELTGPWDPHRLNPVKVDVTSARPAGALLEVDNILYRPAQDCAAGYGRAITIQRVIELSTKAFSEVEVGRMSPPRTQPIRTVCTRWPSPITGCSSTATERSFRPQLLPHGWDDALGAARRQGYQRHRADTRAFESRIADARDPLITCAGRCRSGWSN